MDETGDSHWCRFQAVKILTLPSAESLSLRYMFIIYFTASVLPRASVPTQTEQRDSLNGSLCNEKEVVS